MVAFRTLQNSPKSAEPTRAIQGKFLKKSESRLETKSYRLFRKAANQRHVKPTVTTSSGAGQLVMQSNKAGSLNNRKIELFET